MKHWINSHYKTLIISAFLIPIITVAIVSISHVTQWYGISNPISWAIYLSVGIEIAAMSALAAISANMGKNVYFPFIIVTLIQFIGNIFFAYEYIDMTSKMFQSWVELVSPLVGFMGVEPTDLIGHKRFLALFAGGLLPVISLSFLHMLVKFTEEDRLKDIKEDEESLHPVITENVSVDPEQLKTLVEEAVRVRLSEQELNEIEDILKNTKVTFTEGAVNKLDEIIEQRSKELDGVKNPTPDSSQIAQMSDLNDLREKILEEFQRQLPTKDEVEEKDRVKLTNDDLSNIESFITKKYEDPYDKETEEEIKDWDVTLQDGLEDEPNFKYHGNQYGDDEPVVPVIPPANDDFSSLYHIVEPSDNHPIEVETPKESSDNPPIEEDSVPTEDYYPPKFENDYFVGNNPISEREKFMDEVNEEIYQETLKEEELNDEYPFPPGVIVTDEMINDLDKKKVN